MRRCGSSRRPALASNARDETPAAFSLGRRRRRRRGREKIVVGRPVGEQGHDTGSPDRRHLAATVGRMLSQSQGAAPTRSRVGRGGGLSDDLKVSLFKGTFEFEMHLCLERSRQSIEISANATALRAHHKPTFSVKIAHFTRSRQSTLAHRTDPVGSGGDGDLFGRLISWLIRAPPMGFSKSPMDFSKDKAVRMQLRTATVRLMSITVREEHR